MGETGEERDRWESERVRKMVEERDWRGKEIEEKLSR